MSTPRPTPAVMRGRQDPARGVRPVDYTSWHPSPGARHGGAGSAVEEPVSPSRQGDADPSPDATPVRGPQPLRDRGSTPSNGGAASTVSTAGDGQTAADEGVSRSARSASAAHVASDGRPRPGPAPRGTACPGSTRQDTARELTVDPQLLTFVARLRAGVTPVTATPENAFYTVDSTGSGSHELEVPADGVHVQGVWDVTEDALRAVVADPEDTWTADLGRTDYYVRGKLCVQVSRAEHRVVGIYRSGWAVARRPDETWADTPDSLERTGAKPGGSGTRYPTNRRELLSRLRAAGFEVTTSGPTHGKITHPDVPRRFLPFSSTPSSQRYGRHVVTAVKRVFGIDVR